MMGLYKYWPSWFGWPPFCVLQRALWHKKSILYVEMVIPIIEIEGKNDEDAE